MPTGNDVVLIGNATYPWRSLRTLAASSTTSVTLSSSYEYSSVSASCFDLKTAFGNSFLQAQIAIFSATVSGNAATDGDTFGFILLGYKHNDSSQANPPLLICQTSTTGGVLGTLTGSTLLGTSPLWADTISLSSSDWVGGVTVTDSGQNRIALVSFAPAGVRFLYLIALACSGSGSTAPGIGALITVA
jgi:hypothetical protein